MIGAAVQGRTHRAVVVNRRLRGVIDFIAALGIWAVLVGAAAATYGVYVERAYVAEALSQASLIREEFGVRYAESGLWPTDIDISMMESEAIARPSPKLEVHDGAFSFVFAAGHRVSFRPAVSMASPRAPVVWLCGYAAAPAGYRVAAANRTTVPMLYLPGACRG